MDGVEITSRFLRVFKPVKFLFGLKTVLPAEIDCET